jgi:hypothetical protein
MRFGMIIKSMYFDDKYHDSYSNYFLLFGLYKDFFSSSGNPLVSFIQKYKLMTVIIWKAASPKNIPSTPHHDWLINGRAVNVYKESMSINVNKHIPKAAAVPTSET